VQFNKQILRSSLTIWVTWRHWSRELWTHNIWLHIGCPL